MWGGLLRFFVLLCAHREHASGVLFGVVWSVCFFLYLFIFVVCPLLITINRDGVVVRDVAAVAAAVAVHAVPCRVRRGVSAAPTALLATVEAIFSVTTAACECGDRADSVRSAHPRGRCFWSGNQGVRGKFAARCGAQTGWRGLCVLHGPLIVRE